MYSIFYFGNQVRSLTFRLMLIKPKYSSTPLAEKYFTPLSVSAEATGSGSSWWDLSALLLFSRHEGIRLPKNHPLLTFLKLTLILPICD